MSAIDQLNLRKYNRADGPRSQSSAVKSAVRNQRPNAQIREMLVSRFLSKVTLGVKDSNTTQTRDAELKLQSLVSKEFEKFLAYGQFTQKSLEIFEKDLKARLRDYCDKELHVQLKQISTAASHRMLNPESRHDFREKNSKTVKGEPSIKLPHINANLDKNNNRKSIDVTAGDKGSYLRHAIHKKNASQRVMNYSTNQPPTLSHQKSMVVGN